MMLQHRRLTPFEETVKYFGIDLETCRLYCTAQAALAPQSKKQCALVYIGPDTSGRQAVADFATWLFPWLEERRRDIARLHRAHDRAGAQQQIRAFAGPTEVLRELGPWGQLAWIFAHLMVSHLATERADQDRYAQAYFEGAEEMLQAVLGIHANRPVWQLNRGRPTRPVFETLLVLGLPSGDPLKLMLEGLAPDEQLRLLEQLVFGSVDTFRVPFEPLT